MDAKKTVILGILVCLLLVAELANANIAVGRAGSLRPGKRTLSLGRFNFRPGKRSSVALGRFNFRPGKRAAGVCTEEETNELAHKVDSILVDLQIYGEQLEKCAPGVFEEQ